MKRVFTLFLCFTMVFVLSVPAFAENTNPSQLYPGEIFTSEKYVDPALVGSTCPGSVVPIDDYNEIPVYKETVVTYKDVYVTPTGQPSLGYVGGSNGFVFFFQEGGNKVNFTVTIKSKNVTFQAETGTESSSGSGYGAAIPAGSGYYKFRFLKKYTITTKIYDVYQYSQYKYSYQVHSTAYAITHDWVRA